MSVTMESASTPRPRRLPRPSGLALLSSGRRALREVPRLRLFLLKGFLLNYAFFLITSVLAYYMVYFFFVQPYMARMDQWVTGEGFFWELLILVLNVVQWMTQLLLLVGTLMLSLLFSLAMMSMWLEALAARIVAHCRGESAEAGAFSLVEWVAGLGAAFRDSIRLILLALGALLLGFIPVVGPLLVILVDSYLLGWEIRDPYLAVRQQFGDPRKQLRKGLVLWTIQAGFVPVALSITIVGCLLLPVVMIYMVAGFAWQAEQDLKQHPA